MSRLKSSWIAIARWSGRALAAGTLACCTVSLALGQEFVVPESLEMSVEETLFRLPPVTEEPLYEVTPAAFELFQAEGEQPAEAAVVQPDPMQPVVSSDQTFGQEPPTERVAVQQFLRTQTVLLGAGEWQFDYGLIYSHQEFDYPTINNAILTRADLTRRQLFVPLAFRHGITDYLQSYINVPLGYSHSELATSPQTDPAPIAVNSDTGGCGDIDMGLSWLWRESYGECDPDIILSGGITIPVAEAFSGSSTLVGGLGNGVWAANVSALAVHTYDPMVVYYGLGYRYQFEREFNGTPIHLGQQISYQLGTGFAVNDKITLGAAFLGFFVTETRIDDVGVPGSQFEPLRMRFSMTAWHNCKIVEPFAEIPMTDESPARIGIVWTY